tara:strand:- start:107 stop:1711 length:1605 start_codon:yes stop_codon:yes gene_type:complete
MIKEKEGVNTPAIEYLELSAGMGKTYTTLKWIVADEIPKGSKWLYVGKNIELLGESELLVKSFNKDVVTDSLHTNNCSGVLTSIITLLEGNVLPDILFICHQSLINIIKAGREELLSGWSILVDEVLEVFSIEDCKREKSQDTLFTNMVCLSEKHNMYTAIDGKSFMDKMAKDANYSSFGSSLNKILRCIDKGSRVYIRDSSRDTRVYTTYDVVPMKRVVSTVDRFIMLGARVKDTLHCRFMEKQGVSFIPFKGAIPLRDKYLNQSRVSIYYLTSEKRIRGCTSTLLETAYSYNKGKVVSKKDYRNLPNGVDDLGGDYKLVYQEYIERACDLLGKDFIYTVNYIPFTKNYKDVSMDGFPRGRAVPYACHGLNHLQHYSKALCLFCYKPSVDNKGILSFLSLMMDYPEIEEDFIDEKYRESSYQLCTRSKLRDFSDVQSEITFVVPDKSVAEYIKSYHIPDCNILDDLVLYIPDKRENNGGSNRGFAGTHLKGDTAAQRAYGRYKKKYIKDSDKEPTTEESLSWLKLRNDKRDKK